MGKKILVLLVILALIPLGTALALPQNVEKSRVSLPDVLSKARTAYEAGLRSVGSLELNRSLKSLPEPDSLPPASLDEVEKFQGNFPAEADGSITVIIDLPSKPLASQVKEKGLTISSPEVSSIKNSLAAEQNQAISMMAVAGVSAEIKHTYSTAYNGIAVKIDRKDLEKVQAIFGKDAVHPSKTYYLDMEYSTVLTGATNVWNNLGYKGEGVVVGVVDTGVDYNHPDLGGGFGNKVIDMIDTGDDDNDAMDLNGHGTHVSGIMAANAAAPGGVTGMAPEAKIMVAKIVKGGAGSASSADIAAAFDWMLQKKLEGVNLASINMSFGFPGGWNSPSDPEQVAIQGCVDNGIFVSLSAGNDYWSVYPSNQFYYYGENPSKFTYYPADFGIVGSPATTPGPASVAASWNTNSRYASFLVPETSYRGPYTVGSPSPDPITVFGGVAQNFVYVGYGNDDSYYSGLDVTGKIALLLRGGAGDASFANKVRTAQAHGAVGAIVMNDAARGDAMITMALAADITIPAVFTGYTYGSYLQANPAYTVKFDGQTASFPNPTSDKMVDFSSWGTDPNLNFKPEIAAPGGGIWSTVPLAMGGYANYSGTSMSSPHVGGAAALIKQAHPDWTPAQVKTALMNTASLLTYPGSTLPYSPRLQGAGRINVYDALLTPVLVTDNTTNYPAEPLGDTNADTTKTFTLKAINTGDTDITYNLSATIQRYNTSRVPYTLANGSVTFPGGTSVTVPANDVAFVEVVVNVGGNTQFENIFVDGFIKFVPVGATVPELHVPYTLFWGDWQDTRYTGDWAHNPVIDPPPDDPTGWWWWGYTWLYWAEGTTLYYLGLDFDKNFDRNIIAISPNGDGAQDNLHPLLSLMRGTKDLTLSVLDEEGNLVTTIAHEKYVHKNFSSYPYWSGWDYDWLWAPEPGSVPDGNYIARFEAEIPATLNGPAGGFHTIELPFMVDTVNPEVSITSLYRTGDGLNIEWTGADERSGIWGYVVLADGEMVAILPPDETSFVYDGEPGNVFVVAFDNAGNFGFDYRATVNLHLNKGWNMITPGVVTSGTPAELIGSELVRLYYWNPVTRSYVVPAALTPGNGYWALMRADKDVTLSGDFTSAPFTTALSVGWVMIGNPFEFSYAWSDVVVSDGTNTKTLEEAKATGWVGNALYYNGTGYDTVNYATDLMNPGDGFWLQVKVPGLALEYDIP